jgi:hypothetical protein
MKKKDQPLRGDDTANASEADTQATPPEATPMKGKVTVRRATVEDYERGFSFGAPFGTPYKDLPTLRERM